MLRLILILILPFFALLVFTLLRLIQILSPRRPKPVRRLGDSTHLLVVLGSGGHTAEMIAMLDRAFASPSTTPAAPLWERFTHRTWVVSSGDGISAQRARAFEERISSWRRGSEETKKGQGKRGEEFEIHTVPRAREIHQPVYTAPISSIRCAMACVSILVGIGRANELPDVILCNGPATATIMVFTSVILRFLNVGGCQSQGKMRTIYVESWARVKKLSLSGTLLSKVVDRFLVQWPQLEQTAERAEYIGVLV